VWPHADYPLIEVGKLVLDRNYTDHHTQIEQAAFEPNNQVAGIGLSPLRVLEKHRQRNRRQDRSRGT
jgi:catalase